MVNKSFFDFWRKKKVFITGHTGFKGSWLSLFLQVLDAKVGGYSLPPRKKDIVFLNSNLGKSCKNFYGDIRNYKLLKNAVNNFKPDIIIHMAAQPLVLPSYKNPKSTFEVNYNGTLNILELIKNFKIKSSIIVTTDKVYKNKNKKKNFFKETDYLQGSDPYSSSKVDSENLVKCYNENFFKKENINVATVRAGNVIGGGDRSEYRIIPDFFRALDKKTTLEIRSANAVRPWQYILDPLIGYLILAKKCYEEKKITFNSWNFAQNTKKQILVKDLILELNKFFNVKVKIKGNSKIQMEKKYLNLSSHRANKYLKWKAKYNTRETIEKIINWETSVRKNHKVDKLCKDEIVYFLKSLNKK